MQRSPLEALHLAAGARMLAAGSSAQPLTFGDVPAEYAAGMGGAALFDETERGAVRVDGRDGADFLHRLLANRVKGLEAGQGSRNLLLSSKGKVEHLVDLVCLGSEFHLSTAPGAAPALIAALDRYHFSEQLTLKDQSAEHAPIGLMGPDAERVLAEILGAVPELERGHIFDADFNTGPLRVTRTLVAGSLGWRLDAGPERATALWQRLVKAGARPAGRVAADSLRVEAGQAEAVVDVDDNVYPQEARLEDAFHLAKGCYIGQEVVAKIDTYGGINKRLVLVAIDHDDPLPRGTRLVGVDSATGERRELGLVTSWAYSFTRDGGLALAYVKRRHQRVGTQFEVLLPEGTGVSETTGAAGRAEIVPMPQREGAVAPSGEFE